MSTPQRRDDIPKVLDALRSIVQALRSSARHTEQELGVSSAQLYVLQELQDVPSLSINQLAERTYTHQSSVSMVVAKLVGSRLVSRTSAKTDARMAAISLTPAGRALMRRSHGSAQARLMKGLEAMSRADLRTLSSNLETLTALVQGDDIQFTRSKRRSLMQA